MEKKSFAQFVPLFVGLFLIFGFVACDRFLPSAPQPIDYPLEEQEPVTNDFTLLKACIGKSQSEVSALMTSHDFTTVSGGKFLKTEDGITKEMYVHSVGNVEMNVRNNDFDTLKQVFVQWMNEIRNSVAYTKLVRSSFTLSTGWGNGYQHFNTPEELINALSTVSPAEGMSASFSGNDSYANEYSLTLYPDLGGVFMQIINQRAGQPSDDFTESDLENEDLQKHILISKVDYLTFRYKGFYALNVTDKLNSGDEIPFMAEYQSPGDFGYIKLYYQNINNLLMDGTIIWNGCGALNFPASFRAGLPVSKDLRYPGQSHISFIDNSGTYVTVADDNELQRVWQCVSRQKEFQHYYKHSSKKVAVYLYAPSVGIGNPADAYYLVFTEQ